MAERERRHLRKRKTEVRIKRPIVVRANLSSAELISAWSL